jgi:hypothetical protein
MSLQPEGQRLQELALFPFELSTLFHVRSFEKHVYYFLRREWCSYVAGRGGCSIFGESFAYPAGHMRGIFSVYDVLLVTCEEYSQCTAWRRLVNSYSASCYV